MLACPHSDTSLYQRILEVNGYMNTTCAGKGIVGIGNK